MRTFYPDRAALKSLLPDRTWAAILHRAKHLGCQRALRKLSLEEVQVARLVGDNLGLKAAAERLGRTTRSMSAIRSRFGFTKKRGTRKRPLPQLLVDLRRGATARGRTIQEIGVSIGRVGILSAKTKMPTYLGLFEAAQELGGTIYAEWDD